jgi:Skp family chaperone for outer membrane proteins
MRRASAVFALLLAALPLAAVAQGTAVTPSALVVIDPDQLYLGTLYGRALQADIEAEASALSAENRKIDAALEAEERDLTDKRSTMTADAFRPLADAFDTKANDLRNAQEAKTRELTRRRDTLRQEFFSQIGSIIGDYMVERGAVAVLDKSTVIVSLGSIDITSEVIARIDERLGDGKDLKKP